MKDFKCRFIEEYANFQIALFKQDMDLYADDPKRVKQCDNSIEVIKSTVRETRRGYITVNECMTIIAHPLTYSNYYSYRY